jgi:hypothetical protein
MGKRAARRGSFGTGTGRFDMEANTVGYNGGFTLNPGISQSTVLAGLIPFAQNTSLGTAASATYPGKLRVAFCEIEVHFFNPGVASAAYLYAVGVFKAKWGSSSGSWSTQDPFSAAQANEPWYWLERRSMTLPGNAFVTCGYTNTFRKVVPVNTTIGQGESICVIAANSSGSPAGGSLSVNLYCRAAVTKMW